jgi:hypothetical protein
MRYERLLFWVALFIGLVIIGREALGKFESEVGNSLSEKVAGEIKGATTIGQTFVAPHPDLHRIDVFLATYARTNTHDVTFHLKASPESEEDIFAISFNASDVEDNAYRSFVFPPIRESEGKSFYFYLESPSSTPGDAITVWMSNSDAYPEGSAYIDGEPVRGDLRFLTHYSLGYLDKINLLLDRLAENKPYIFGDKRFYIFLGVIYLLLLILFLNRVVEFAFDDGSRFVRGEKEKAEGITPASSFNKERE